MVVTFGDNTRALSTNKIIQGLWIGPGLSSLEQLSIRSFLAHGHQYHLYVYNAVDGVPPGTVLQDANEIIRSEKIFKYREHDSYAGFSNYFRYKLLLDKGGWWADLDLVCLKPFDFEDDYVFSSERTAEANGSGESVNIGAIKLPPASDLARYVWEVCQEKDPKRLAWGETGPRLMAEAVARFSLGRYVKSASTFCPLSWGAWKKVLSRESGWRPGDDSYAIHLWNEMWRRDGTDKNQPYDPECLYEQLKTVYLRSSGTKAPGGSSSARITLPSVSAVVLSKNGASRLARCLESIRDSNFADEIVVCVDADTTDDTAQLARRFTDRVHMVRTEGTLETALPKMASLCSGDFVLRVDDDECLAGDWDKESFQLLVSLNSLTHLWVSRRWLTPPGDAFIANSPWFPDLHLRLFVNKPGLIYWPKSVHEHMKVRGQSLVLFDRWINHLNLILKSRAERERRCAEYLTLAPQNAVSRMYLYEEQHVELLPRDAPGVLAAAQLEKARFTPEAPAGYYRIGLEIDFRAGGNAANYTLAGWGMPEKWGTWTIDHEAEVCLPLDAPIGGPATLSMQVRPYMNERHPALHVEVLYRDQVLGRWSFESATRVHRTLMVPGGLIADDSAPLFRFRILDPRSPSEIGESADSRLLGLGFDTLRLDDR